MPDGSGHQAFRNGRARAAIGGLAVADGAAAYDDPMSKVLGLDAQSSGPLQWVVYTLGALALLLGLAVTARVVTVILASMDPQAQAVAVEPQEIDVMRDEPPPPPPPAPEETEAKPEPAAPAPVAKPAPHDAPPPPPAPAQAAKVLAQEPDPNEPVDLTGNTIIQGNADAYAGGTTMANGTSNRAVRSLASPAGVPGGTGAPTAKAPSGPDRARGASPVNTDWNAPFPPEADTAQIDEAYVTLQIDVRADGTATSATVLVDPGNGFGREARKYALTQRYNPAFDRDGNPIPTRIKTKVHFSR
ncbi:MAG TPA: energy transducer TonB [Polyangiaceae bacterium]|jgi:protein TonB|nr:energy transducer TonB [Polyangiaceae bacterium]